MNGQLLDSRRIHRDALLNALALGVSSAAGIVIVPILLHGLGATLFGVYASAGALAAIVAIDFGLGTATAREIAMGAGGANEDAADFVSTAFALQMILAVAGSLLVVAIGYGLTIGGAVTAEARNDARLIVWLVAAAVAGDQITAAAASLLAGLRRFVFTNALLITVAVFRVSGALVIVHRRSAIEAVMFFALLSLTTAAITVAYAASRDRIALLRPLSWSAVRARARFAGLAQLLQFTSKANWQIAVPLVSSIRSAAAAASVSVGQKFPLATMALNWRATEVLMPAASEGSALGGGDGVRRVIDTGTRGISLLAMQPFILFVVLAPSIISIWTGAADSVAVDVLRLLAAAMLIDALAYPASQALIAAGAMEPLVAAWSVALVVNVVLSVALQLVIGPAGAAWGVLAAIIVATALILRGGASRLAFSFGDVTRAMLPALVASALSAAALLALVRRRPPSSLLTLAVYAAASTAVYAAAGAAAFAVRRRGE
jgi:O-antigen/teichoic acid export membrane protein